MCCSIHKIREEIILEKRGGPEVKCVSRTMNEEQSLWTGAYFFLLQQRRLEEISYEILFFNPLVSQICVMNEAKVHMPQERLGLNPVIHAIESSCGLNDVHGLGLIYGKRNRI